MLAQALKDNASCRGIDAHGKGLSAEQQLDHTLAEQHLHNLLHYWQQTCTNILLECLTSGIPIFVIACHYFFTTATLRISQSFEPHGLPPQLFYCPWHSSERILP